MDRLTKDQRRKNMQHIKPYDTKIEIILRKALWQKESDTEKIIKACREPPILSLQNIKLPFFVMGIFFMAKIGKC